MTQTSLLSNGQTFETDMASEDLYVAADLIGADFRFQQDVNEISIRINFTDPVHIKKASK